jgi:hypothetical protein
LIVKGCPEVIPRAQWKARNAKDQTMLITPVSYVIIHDTVTTTCYTHNACVKRIQDIQKYHMDEKGERK